MSDPGPSRERILAIKALTYTDREGRRYFKTRYGGSLMRLQSAESFLKLNAAIDLYVASPRSIA